MASKCEKITQKWQKRAKGCALSKPRQYFSWGARKKNTHFFTKKLSWRRIEPRIIWWEATALPTEPQRRSHWTKLKTWSHSYLGCEIFSGSKLCLEATLHFTMCVCVCVCARHCVQKFGKIHGELNSRCLHERPIHYQMSHTGLSIWVIILPNKCSKCTWKLLQKFDLSWDRTRAVTHPSTNPAKYRLTSVIRPELVLSTWYGCTHVFYFVFCNIKVIHELLNLHAKS